MSDPFRLRVLKELTSTLESIYPENPDRLFDYSYDLRGKVFRGRNRFGQNDPLPMISLLEAPIPLETLVGRNDNVNSTGPWEILVQGFVKDDINHPSDPAHHMMAEIKAVLVNEKLRDRGRNIFGMGGRVDQLLLGQGSVRPPDEASDKGFFWLTMTLHLAEDLLNPYA